MEIRPFRGWRYCDSEGNVGPYIAPPYDVLSERRRDELLSRNIRNIVAVDLPHFPPSEVGPDREYDHAEWVLGEWKGTGVICRDSRPALYAYEQEFRWCGETFSRRAMICGVRATELGKDIIPHEHTFAGPKADRLKLTEKTRMQLSPIFGFYNEPGGAAADALWSATSGMPDVWGELDGVTERLWVVDSPAVVAAVAAALRDVPVFIADGHHRCTTAMSYRDRLLADGRIDGNHEANFVMFALVPDDDPGLLVLPTHRIVRGLNSLFTVEKLTLATPEFTWRRCSLDDMDFSNADESLHRYGSGAMALIDSHMAEVWIAKLRDAGAMSAEAPNETDDWRRLDVAILHKLIIDKALAPWRTKDVFIEYTPDGQVVRTACESSRAQLGVCLQAAPLAAIRRIALAGSAMPHKSTYFHPKPATGMVLKPLE